MYVCKQFGIDTERPMICQVSRFDPWKDPLGVIDAYRLVKEERPEVQLALVGSMASDDPEGWDFYNSTLAHADGDPDIHILNNFNNVGAIEVNAFQSLSEVVIQKSTREGFGLTVSEALWKGRPFIGGNVGGIPLQVQDGETGYLVDSVEECAARIGDDPRRPGARPVARPARQGARARAFPHAALPARLSEDLPRGAVMGRPAAGPGLQPRARHLRGRRVGQARHRRAGDGADRPRVAPRRDLDRLGDDRRRRASSRRSTAGGRSRSRRPRAAPTTCASSPPTPRPTTASTTSSPTRCSGSSSTTCGTRATRRTSAATRSRRSSTATRSSTTTSRRRCWRRSRARTSRS